MRARVRVCGDIFVSAHIMLTTRAIKLSRWAYVECGRMNDARKLFVSRTDTRTQTHFVSPQSQIKFCECVWFAKCPVKHKREHEHALRFISLRMRVDIARTLSADFDGAVPSVSSFVFLRPGCADAFLCATRRRGSNVNFVMACCDGIPKNARNVHEQVYDVGKTKQLYEGVQQEANKYHVGACQNAHNGLCV